MQRRLALASTLAVLLSLGGVTGAVAQTCPPTDPDTPSTGLQAVLKEINNYRSLSGAPPLTLDARLTKAAQAHADDMAAKNYFSHTSLDGRSAGQRITAAGYTWRTYGENIAMGYADWSAALRGWMNSAGHRRNMLSPSFQHIGLGVKDRRYVQDFGAPR